MKLTFEARGGACPKGKDGMTIHCWSSTSSKPNFVCTACGVEFPGDLIWFLDEGPFGAAYLTEAELREAIPQCRQLKDEAEKNSEVLEVFQKMGDGRTGV